MGLYIFLKKGTMKIIGSFLYSDYYVLEPAYFFNCSPDVIVAPLFPRLLFQLQLISTEDRNTDQYDNIIGNCFSACVLP